MSRPLDTEYGSFYKGYADAATGASIEAVLDVHPAYIKKHILEIPEEKSKKKKTQ